MIYTKNEIMEKVIPVSKKYNIKKLYLFGSYAKGEAKENSDNEIKKVIEKRSSL